MNLALWLWLAAAGVPEANRLFESGRLQQAAAEYQRVLAANPDDAGALTGLGKSLIALGRSKDAVPHLEHARRLAPGNIEAGRFLALGLHEAGRLHDAENLLRTLVRESPKDGESWYFLGSLLYQHGFWAASLEAMEKALALPARSGNLKARKYRAICLSQVGRAEEAEKALVELVNDPRLPRDGELLNAYAQLLFESGRTEAALGRVDQALEAERANFIARFLRARILLQLNRVDEAAREAEQSVTLAPQWPFARNLLVKIYRLQRRDADAARQVEWLRQYEDAKTRPPAQ